MVHCHLWHAHLPMLVLCKYGVHSSLRSFILLVPVLRILILHVPVLRIPKMTNLYMRSHLNYGQRSALCSIGCVCEILVIVFASISELLIMMTAVNKILYNQTIYLQLPHSQITNPQ